MVDKDQEEFEKILQEAAELRKVKNRLYKDSWRGLGYQGEFPALYHKMNRLKALIWDGVSVGADERNESAENNLLDIIVVAAHMLMLWREE